MPRKYKINHSAKLIKDEASTKFHVASDDYFGTIATILNLLKQEIKENNGKNYTTIQKTFSNLENDLLFLQKNYRINPRVKAKVKPKVKTKKQKK